MPGGSGAVTEGPTNFPSLQRSTFEYIVWHFRIAKEHSPQTNEVRLVGADHVLGDIWQPFLQV